jgi:hypothetical protein
MQFDDLNFGSSVNQQMYSAADLMQLQMDDILSYGVNKPGCTVCSFTCASATA